MNKDLLKIRRQRFAKSHPWNSCVRLTEHQYEQVSSMAIEQGTDRSGVIRCLIDDAIRRRNALPYGSSETDSDTNTDARFAAREDRLENKPNPRIKLGQCPLAEDVR